MHTASAQREILDAIATRWVVAGGLQVERVT